MPLLAADTQPSLLSGYSALLVAFVAGAFSLLGLTVSKENKVSEFRQAWIDALRQDIAEVVAQAQIIHSETLEYLRGGCTRLEYRQHLDRTQIARLDLNRAATRIKLRINPNEKYNQDLMRYIGELQAQIENPPSDLEEFRALFGPASVKIEKQTSLILAKEWKRVKAVEAGYRHAKATALVALFLSVVICVALFIETSHVTFSRRKPWVKIGQWQ